MIYIPEYVEKLNPYRAGNEQKAGVGVGLTEPINLASNENLLGPSPKAIEYMKKAMDKANYYPEPSSSELVRVIADSTGKKPGQIICGHGSESLIGHIINSFSDVGDEVITASGTFIGIFVITNKLGRQLKCVPLKNYKYDLYGILDAYDNNTKIIYIANPNNPTGTMITKEEFDDFLSLVPKNILVIYDEAYFVYTKQFKDYPDGLEYDRKNLIVLRTLSKSHGLAGVRIGYAIGPEELIRIVYKVKFPFEPSLVAQYAAIGAFQDDEFVGRTLKINKLSLDMLISKFDELGIEYAKPTANFVMILFQTEEIAANFTRLCAVNGVLVRHVNTFGVPHGVRISTGTLSLTEYAISVFEKVYYEIKQ